MKCIWKKKTGETFLHTKSFQFEIRTGPEPDLYRSFDNIEDLILREGIEQKNYGPLVSGQVKLPKLL